MRPITLTVDAPPPTRRDDGLCANRSSPNAMPLFHAATAIVAAADPDEFPIRQFVHLTITSSEPLPDTWRDHGYTVSTAIIEVLVDARLLDDEDCGESVREEVKPGMRGYFISIEDSPFGGDSIGPSQEPELM